MSTRSPVIAVRIVEPAPSLGETAARFVGVCARLGWLGETEPPASGEPTARGQAGTGDRPGEEVSVMR